MTVYADPG